MKKILSIFLIFIMLFGSVPVSANVSERDHNELMKYKGYGETMYEAVVEQTTFITGKYTDNKQYVSESIDKIKDYAKFWAEEPSNWLDDFKDCSGDSILKGYPCFFETAFEYGGGYMLTVGDWLKKLFNDYDVSENSVGDDLAVYDFSSYEKYFRIENNVLYVKYPYVVKISGFLDGSTMVLDAGSSLNPYVTASYNDKTGYGEYQFRVNEKKVTPYFEYGYEKTKSYVDYFNNNRNGTVSGIMNNFYKTGATMSIYLDDTELDITKPSSTPRNNNIKNINNYIQDGNLDNKQMIIPEIQPYLSCAEKGRIDLTIIGSNFYLLDGTQIPITYDGIADLNGENCELNWDKPVYKYIDNRVIQETRDGKQTDVETGEKITGEQPSGCDNVICFLSRILESISNLVTKLLDGILALFVPKDLDFVTDLFDDMQMKFNEKFDVLITVKDTITGVFEETEDNTLKDYYIELPILNNKPIELINFDYVDPFVGYAKKFVSALVGFFTIFYVYRKITGSGGVMEK